MKLQFFNDFTFYPKVTFPPIRNRFVKGTLYKVLGEVNRSKQPQIYHWSIKWFYLLGPQHKLVVKSTKNYIWCSQRFYFCLPGTRIWGSFEEIVVHSRRFFALESLDFEFLTIANEMHRILSKLFEHGIKKCLAWIPTVNWTNYIKLYFQQFCEYLKVVLPLQSHLLTGASELHAIRAIAISQVHGEVSHSNSVHTLTRFNPICPF